MFNRDFASYYWAREASPTRGCSIEISRDKLSTIIPTMVELLEKWFPLQGERAHSLNFFVVCMYVNRKEEE